MGLLNFVVTEHGHRSLKVLGSGLRLLPQETLSAVYSHTGK